MIVYMIRNKTTGKFWNGQTSWAAWGDTGRQWKKKKGAEEQIAFYFRYQERYKTTPTQTFEDWEILAVDATPVVKSSEDVTSLLTHVRLRYQLEKVSIGFSSFLSVMRDKGVEDKIQCIMDLEPSPGMYRVDRERIKEARSQLRGMGIKTRTFREYRGMFGFLDRQQAMQARLVLNARRFVDVQKLRDELPTAV